MKKFTPEEVTTITSDYKAGLGVSTISKRYNMGRRPIERLLKEYQIPKHSISAANRKYKFNEHYFDKIDTKDKAYFLGWLYADGYNCKSAGMVSLGMNKKDIEILEKFKHYIESEHNIYSINSDNTVRLTIGSQYLCDKLDQLGCIPAKSLVVEWPLFIPSYLVKFFIRGYFEGDGCISVFLDKNRPTFQLSVMSSHKFINGLQQFCEIELGIKFGNYTRINNGLLALSRRGEIIKFLNWLYSDLGDLFLTRKYNKYLEAKLSLKQNPYRRKTKGNVILV